MNFAVTAQEEYSVKISYNIPEMPFVSTVGMKYGTQWGHRVQSSGVNADVCVSRTCFAAQTRRINHLADRKVAGYVSQHSSRWVMGCCVND